FYVIPYKWVGISNLKFAVRSIAANLFVSAILIVVFLLGWIPGNLTISQFIVSQIVYCGLSFHTYSLAEGHLKERFGLSSDATNFQFNKKEKEMNSVLLTNDQNERRIKLISLAEEKVMRDAIEERLKEDRAWEQRIKEIETRRR